MADLSKTQIDRLGDRLKKGNISDDDLRMLDEYRRSFSHAYEIVENAIRQELGLEPTGRPAKSTTSISEKLKRETIRLTQVQDIAGCRLVVGDILEQEVVVKRLEKVFNDVTIVDRRKKPSHGYRAVHVIVKVADKLVEIQARTALQHLWAEQSEKLSDVVDPAIKYGGGNEKMQELLGMTSDVIAEEEMFELELDRDQKYLSEVLAQGTVNRELEQQIIRYLGEMQERQQRIASIRQKLAVGLRDAIDKLPRVN